MPTSFPDDIILEICSYLSYKEIYRGPLRVCKKWAALLDRILDPSKDYEKGLRYGIRKNNLDVLRKVLSDGRADPTYNDNVGMKYAIKNGMTLVANILYTHKKVSNQANIDSITKSLLSIGCKAHICTDITYYAKMLANYPFLNPSCYDNELIFTTLKSQNFEMLCLLLKQPSVKITQKDIDKINEFDSIGQCQRKILDDICRSRGFIQ